MGLSPSMTVRYKLLPDKMVLWNEFLPSLGDTVEPTTRSDVPTTGKADDKKDTTIKSYCDTCLTYLVFFFEESSVQSTTRSVRSKADDKKGT